MSDFSRLAPLFEQTLAARGHTHATRESYLGALRRFSGFVGSTPLDQIAKDTSWITSATSRRAD